MTHPPATDRPGQVVHLADFNPLNPARIMTEMQAYWDGLRRNRAVPARSDIQPQGIRRALDYAFILERIAPGAARFRLAGQHLIDLMGMEVRGMAFCSLANTSSRGRLSDVLESVFRTPQLAQLTLHAKADYARPELSAQMLLLPLSSDLGDVTRALGCIIATGQIGVAPRRFDLTHDEVMPILAGGKTVAPSPSNVERDRPGMRDPASPRQISATQAPAKVATTPEARRSGFTVISFPQSAMTTGTTKT
ncbi:PAS domain-containing protein [Paracoccus subflavus]|nr:PAS domain-containing protein [Paracoccus subflavus]